MSWNCPETSKMLSTLLTNSSTGPILSGITTKFATSPSGSFSTSCVSVRM